MNIRYCRYGMMVLAAFLIGAALQPVWGDEAPRLITTDELVKMLPNPDTYVLDVRTGSDWRSSGFKIKGAYRADPDEYARWASIYPQTATLVLYCA
jgi:rhodanese-related sulfurtransferase